MTLFLKMSPYNRTNKKLTFEKKFLARHRSRTRPSRRRTKEIHSNDGNSSKIINYTFSKNVSLQHRKNKKLTLEKKILACHRSRTHPSQRRTKEIHAYDGNSSKIINYTFSQNVSLQHRTNKK